MAEEQPEPVVVTVAEEPQPAATPHHLAPQPVVLAANWKRPFCGCCSPCNHCCMVCWCPCIAFGQAWEKADGSNCIGCSLIFLVPILDCLALTKLRGKVREVRGITGTVVNDFFASWCCSCCTLVQIRSELDDVNIERH